MSSGILDFINKYLPILFGCHCRSDRSFSYKGKQFPICARCTGELAGFLIALVSVFFYRPSIWVLLVLMVPLIVDGTVQKLTSYESTNSRRFVTGILFGYGLMVLFLVSVIATVDLGFQTGLKIFRK